MRTDVTRHATSSAGLSSGWGPVLSGAAAAFLTFVSVSAFWMALAASDVAWISGNLPWFELATALGAAVVAGLVTGRLQYGDRSSGLMRGLAAWGLVLVAGLVIGVPATTALFAGATNLTLQAITTGGDVAAQLSGLTSELWVTFIVFAGGGLLAAAAGGATAASVPETGHPEWRTERVEGDGHARSDRELTGQTAR